MVCTDLELHGLGGPADEPGMRAFDLEVFYGDRVAVLGSNGSGKSHFLRLLALGGTDPGIEHRPVSAEPLESGAARRARRCSARGSGPGSSTRPTPTPS